LYYLWQSTQSLAPIASIFNLQPQWTPLESIYEN